MNGCFGVAPTAVLVAELGRDPSVRSTTGSGGNRTLAFRPEADIRPPTRCGPSTRLRHSRMSRRLSQM
jgi:hypothetical protein